VTVERARGVGGCHELARRSPALGRALLEEPDRVAVAVREVLQLRLLERGGESDGYRVIGKSHALADGGDRRRVGRLVGAERVGLVVQRDATSRRHIGAMVSRRREDGIATGYRHYEDGDRHDPATAPEHLAPNE